MPEAYGVVGLTTVFITFSDIFILNGFNIALIRKEKAEDIDYSTVMVLSLSLSAIVYSVFFLAAPYIASFYTTPELSPVLRTITLLLFFQSVATVIRSKGTRELRFKEMSLVSLASSVLGSLVGLVMAYTGFGCWALVAQQIVTNAFDMLFMIIAFKWRLTLRFSGIVAKDMLKFTMGVLGSSFLDFLGNNANGLVIGKAYSPTDLAYYNRGNMYPETISLNTYNSINSVLLPALASKQKDLEAMKRIVRRVISLTEYIILPMMVGMAAVADNFVEVVLTEKWNACIPIIISACICYSINPVRAIGYNVFYAKGESGRSVRIELFRSVFMLGNLFVTIITLKKSIYVLATMNAVIALLVAFVTHLHVKQCIGYSFRELFSDIAPSAAMSMGMLVLVRLIKLIPVSQTIVFILQILLGASLYVFLSIITKNKNLQYLADYICEKYRRIMKSGAKQ